MDLSIYIASYSDASKAPRIWNMVLNLSCYPGETRLCSEEDGSKAREWFLNRTKEVVCCRMSAHDGSLSDVAV